MGKIKLTIAVTGLNAHDNPGPGIPVARALRESGEFELRIIGLAYENLEPGIFLDHIIDKTYLIPYPQEGMDVLLSRLSYIHSKEQLNVIIPNFDAELINFIKLTGQLREMGIKTFLPTLEQFEERQKPNLEDFGKKYDINVPSAEPIFSFNEFDKTIEEDYGYPLVVKGKFYDAYIAYNKEQASSFFYKVYAKWGLPVIIQRFIKGTEVNITALGDGKGNTIAAVPMKKLYITDKGKGWSGITLADEKLIELTTKLMHETKWRGGLELELIKDEDNDLFLVEINPRLPAWVYLSVGAGQNIPEALVKLALGMDVKPYSEIKPGVMFVRYSYDMITHISKFEKLAIEGEL